MRIGLFTPGLHSIKGGIERFSVNLASWLASRGHEPVFYYINHLRDETVYPVPPQSEEECLSFSPDINPNREKYLRRNLDVFCFFTSGPHQNWLLRGLVNTGIPLLISERNTPRVIRTYYNSLMERAAVLAAADVLHWQFASYLDYTPDFLKNRAVIIPNPCAIPEQSPNLPREKMILCAARFDEHQKRILLLLDAFARIASDFPEWNLCLCGSGDGHESYLGFLDQSRLRHRVQFPGEIRNMGDWYDRASIFCLSSAFEGCPNAMLEAQAHGLPLAGFADCDGVNCIIKNGENGLLASPMTGQGLAEVLAKMLRDENLRKKCGQTSEKLARSFEPSAIYPQWENLLERASRSKGKTRLQFSPMDDETAAHRGMRYLFSGGMSLPIELKNFYRNSANFRNKIAQKFLADRKRKK